MFSSWSIGSIQLGHKVVMSPMTRLRNKNYAPTEDVVNYYRQRSSDGGLIITESIAVNAEGLAWPVMPGIWNDAQVVAWKNVTRAVHCQGGKIFAQLFHCGRISHSSILPGNCPPDAPSAIQPKGTTINAYGLRVPFEKPNELTIPVINRTIRSYVQAAENCVRAEFDGIEIHCGDGFLIEQFMHRVSNKRTDNFGDPLEFVTMVMRSIRQAVDIPVGFKITPFGIQNDCGDKDINYVISLYSSLLGKAIDLDYVSITEPRINLDTSLLRGAAHNQLEQANIQQSKLAAVIFKPFWSKTIIGNGGYEPIQEQPLISNNTIDAIAFGRWFTSNPSLPDKIKNSKPLTKYDSTTFYNGGKQGYTTFE